MGILLAFIAMISWGLGDFLIQKSARKFGDLVALFWITAFGSIVLFPFILKDLNQVFLTQDGLPLLLLASVIILFASLFDFEALRIGKISVIEPIYSFEVPLATAIAAIAINEKLTLVEYSLIGTVLLGIVLVATRSAQSLHAKLERGVFFAILATIAMAASNFLFGVGSRETSPLMVNWFTSSFLAVITGAALVWQGRFSEIFRDFKRAPGLALTMSTFDNLAWVSFSASMLYIPIGIATGISESYIALAAMLGIIFNREKLKRHQFVGLAICLVSVVALALVTDR